MTKHLTQFKVGLSDYLMDMVRAAAKENDCSMAEEVRVRLLTTFLPDFAEQIRKIAKIDWKGTHD